MSNHTPRDGYRALEAQQAEATKEIVAAAIESGRMSWLNDHERPRPRPQSLAGRNYGGYNAVALEAHARALDSDSMQFGTARQFRQCGFDIAKGAQGVDLVSWQTRGWRAQRDEDGLPAVDRHGRMRRESYELPEPRPTTYTVYHASQVVARSPSAQLPEPTCPPALPDEEARAAALALAEALDVRVRRADAQYARSTGSEIVMPASESIPSGRAEARALVSALADHVARSGAWQPGGRDFAWRSPLARTMAAHQLGHDLGLGSTTLNFTPQHRLSVANMVRRQPQRLLRATGDASERAAFIASPERRERLAELSRKRSSWRAAPRTRPPAREREAQAPAR